MKPFACIVKQYLPKKLIQECTKQMMKMKNKRDRFLWQTVLALFCGLWLLAGASACNQTDEETAVTLTPTETTVPGPEQIVTRLVQQQIIITATPSASEADLELVELDVGYTGSFPVTDPQLAQSKSGLDLVENLFVGLTRFNHRDKVVEPQLAAAWDVAENGRVWTFHLRDDIYWVRPTSPVRGQTLWRAQPIRPVVADDLVYAVQRICQRRTGTPDAVILFIIEGCEAVYMAGQPAAADLNQIGVKALDEFTLQFRLTKPSSYFLTMTSLPIMKPVPTEQVLAHDNRWLESDNLYVNGPFVPVLSTWGQGRLVLHPNPLWPLSQQGNVSVVNITFSENQTNAFKLWQARSLDVSPLPDAERITFTTFNPDRSRLVAPQTVFYLGFNFESGVFSNPNLRRAFSAAVDREALIAELLEAQAIPMRHMTPPGVVGAPPFDEVGLGYSPDFARLQIAESPYRTCRLMPPFTLLVSTSDLSLRQAEILRRMWVNELDCEESQIIIEQAQFGTLLANTRRNAGGARPDMWELGWSSYYPDAHNWLSDLLHCQDSENRQIRPCSGPDELIRQAAITQDIDERRQLYRQVETQFFGMDGLMPVAPLYAQGQRVAIQSWLSYTPAAFGGEQFDTYTIDVTLKQLERSRQQRS
jgi:oligopeptide transport system substrate-binding protein